MRLNRASTVYQKYARKPIKMRNCAVTPLLSGQLETHAVSTKLAKTSIRVKMSSDERGLFPSSDGSDSAIFCSWNDEIIVRNSLIIITQVRLCYLNKLPEP